VRPPVLGGNVREGVFATRSPNRPNSIGLTSVELVSIDLGCADAPVLTVAGADLMDGTPIYDIKPYIMADCHPEAFEGFNRAGYARGLELDEDADILRLVPEDKRAGLIEILRADPRPSYHSDPERIYGLRYGDQDVRFKVSGRTLTIVEIKDSESGKTLSAGPGSRA